MSGIIAIGLSMLLLDYALIMKLVLSAREEKQRRYQIERAKVEMIIAQYQAQQIATLLFDNLTSGDDAD